MTIFERIQAVLTFRNGTIVNLDESSIISASIKRQCCSDGKFEIGGVYAASLSMKCRVSGTNSFRIRGAKLVVSTKFEGVENDFIPRGTFWITDAPRTGEIYSITAVDNVGWLDLDNYTTFPEKGDGQQSVWRNFTEYFRTYITSKYGDLQELHTIAGYMTEAANSLSERMTGLQNILQWGHYVEGHTDEITGEWVGNELYCNHIDDLANKSDIAHNRNVYSLFWESDKYFSGTPIELYKKIAEIAGGFIYARPEDGWLTLGQFGQKEFYDKDGCITKSMIQIYPEQMEYDSFEFADFYLQIYRITAKNNYSEKNNIGDHYPINSEYYYPGGWNVMPLEACSPYEFILENNSFIDGYVYLHVFEDSTHGLKHHDNLFVFCKAIFDYLNDRENRPLVPFRCKVHKPERYQLGQRIQFYDENNTAVCDSVITSIQWTFRGGTWLSCAGKDERVLSGCARLSKADKSIRAVNANYLYEREWGYDK
jgi:hypothetical protein